MSKSVYVHHDFSRLISGPIIFVHFLSCFFCLLYIFLFYFMTDVSGSVYAHCDFFSHYCLKRCFPLAVCFLATFFLYIFPVFFATCTFLLGFFITRVSGSAYVHHDCFPHVYFFLITGMSGPAYGATTDPGTPFFTFFPPLI